MQKGLKTKEAAIKRLLEEEREVYLDRACRLTNPFYSDFYVQCIESTMADGYEIFLEEHSSANYFRMNMERMNQEATRRFYKLAGIHHTLWILCHKKRVLHWDGMKEPFRQVYDLTDKEMEMTEILYRCAFGNRSRFQDLFARFTAKYLFYTHCLTPFLLAFLLNFWYNSYSSFMASFTGYVPFHIRWGKAFVG